MEATEAYIERVDYLDFTFNAYLTVCRKEALQAAHEAQQAIAQGNYQGPMHGIPVGVKDQFWSKGIRSTGGLPSVRGQPGAADSVHPFDMLRTGLAYPPEA